MVEVNPRNADPVAPPRQPDTTDVSVGWILGLGVGLALLALVINVLLWWVFQFYTGGKANVNSWTAARAPEAAGRLPPEPRVEGLEPIDVLQQPDLQAEKLAQSYGWVDREKQVVRIPVSEAGKLLLLSGELRARPAPPAGAGPTEDRQMPVPSNSGRSFSEAMP